MISILYSYDILNSKLKGCEEKMDFFSFLNMLGGLCLFLFGMNIMGQALERRAGSKLSSVLCKMTTNKFAGFLTGCGVTSVIQSSSATTVMVVGFVNSGIMNLKQAINVIIGANVGTTITAWILSLSGISGESFLIKLLKPSSFTPILALIGIILYMFCKNAKKQDSGLILLGFATLMFGMETMSSSVSGLAQVSAFRDAFIMFTNPLLGVLAGALLTGIIQSSSASVGILQALASTGQVTFGAAIPIIMGQNIGTCVTALISSVGANKNAKRAAFVHLSFNVIGTVICLSVFSAVKAIFSPAILGDAISSFQIAIVHTCFNLICVIILLPMTGLLEKIALKVIKDGKKPDKIIELDERLLSTPALAVKQCVNITNEMASLSVKNLKSSISLINNFDSKTYDKILKTEEKVDKYEDMLGTYIIKLSSQKMTDRDSELTTEILKAIGDFERISDHAVNISKSALEMNDKKLSFSETAMKELNQLFGAVNEITDMTLSSFINSDVKKAKSVEPLEQVIDELKETVRSRHIKRMKDGKCSIEAGFVLSDLLTNLERVSDHCSNIAGCLIDSSEHNLDIHKTLRYTKSENESFKNMFKDYEEKYMAF